MTDDKSKRGAADRGTAAAGQGYEVRYFASKHGISHQEARDLMSRIGNNRAKLNAAAEKIRRPHRPTKRRLRRPTSR